MKFLGLLFVAVVVYLGHFRGKTEKRPESVGVPPINCVKQIHGADPVCEQWVPQSGDSQKLQPTPKQKTQPSPVPQPSPKPTPQSKLENIKTIRLGVHTDRTGNFNDGPSGRLSRPWNNWINAMRIKAGLDRNGNWTDQSLLEFILKRWARVDSKAANELQARAKLFFEQTQFINGDMQDFEIKPPKGEANYEALAISIIYDKDSIKMNYRINSPIWKKLDSFNRFRLILTALVAPNLRDFEDHRFDLRMSSGIFDRIVPLDSDGLKFQRSHFGLYSPVLVGFLHLLFESDFDSVHYKTSEEVAIWEAINYQNYLGMLGLEKRGTSEAGLFYPDYFERIGLSSSQFDEVSEKMEQQAENLSQSEWKRVWIEKIKAVEKQRQPESAKAKAQKK